MGKRKKKKEIPKMEAFVCQICEHVIEKALDFAISVCKKCANYAVHMLHQSIQMIKKKEELDKLGQDAQKDSVEFHNSLGCNKKK
jgi:ribosomal protein L37AE/L43A